MGKKDNIEAVALELYHQFQIRWMPASGFMFTLVRFCFYWYQSRLLSVKSITLVVSAKPLKPLWNLAVMPSCPVRVILGVEENELCVLGGRMRDIECGGYSVALSEPFLKPRVRICEPGLEEGWRTCEGVVHWAMKLNAAPWTSSGSRSGWELLPSFFGKCTWFQHQSLPCESKPFSTFHDWPSEP